MNPLTWYIQALDQEIRTGHRTKLANTKFEQFLLNKKIIHQTSSGYSHLQCGVNKRASCTIVEEALKYAV